jgi:hypothetical protein
MNAVLKVLQQHGVDASEEELAQALARALEEAGFSVPHGDPRAHLDPQTVEYLEQGGFDPDRLDFGVRDPVIRGALEHAILRTTSLTTREAARRLRVNDSRIRQRLASRTLYGIKIDDAWRLPAFQFRNKRLVPVIERVLRRLPGNLHPVAVHRWFHLAHPELMSDEQALSPLQWLEAGHDPEIVADLAAGL